MDAIPKKTLMGPAGRASTSMKPKRISQGGQMPLTESAANSRQPSAKTTAPLKRKSSNVAAQSASASSSRLPRPSASATKGRASSSAQKRSASSSAARGRKVMAVGAGPGVGGNNYVTPRSVSSGARTPQRMKHLGVTGNAAAAARFSMGGSSTRGSAMGVKASKDSRPLHDQAWRKKAIMEIMFFLNTQGYHKMLSQTDFPLNSTDFKGVFDFLMKILIPSYEIPQRKLELELPQQLKTLGYNGPLSKSSFQTLGTPHAWPNVLGVLHYLTQRAMTVFKHDEEMISQCFPNTDEDGFERDFGESEGKILYETNIDCYQAFLNGDDEEHMDRFLTDYQDRLLRNYGVSRDKMSLIQRERTSLQDDRERLSRAPDQCRDIERSILEHQNAIDSYILFEEQTKAWMAKKKTELTHIKGRIVDFEERTRRMKIEIDDATKSCGLKGINPESAAASRMDNKAKDLQNQIELKKTMQRETSNRVSDLELKLSKEKMEVGKAVGNLQSTLLQLGLLPDHPTMSAASSSRPQDAMGPVQTLHGDLMAKARELRKNRDETSSALEKVDQKRKGLFKESEELESATKRLQDDIRAFEEQMELDDAAANRKLEATRALLFRRKEQQAGVEDVKRQLQAQVIAAEKDFTAKKDERQKELGEAHGKVKTGAEQVGEWRVKRLKERLEMYKIYKAECIEMVREKVELQSRVTAMTDKMLNTPLPDSDDESQPKK